MLVRVYTPQPTCPWARYTREASNFLYAVASQAKLWYRPRLISRLWVVALLGKVQKQ